MRSVLLLSAVALLLTPLAVRAGDTNPSAPNPSDTEIRKIEGIFGSDLPTTEPKGSARLVVHPHVGDLTNRDYLRTLIGTRIGATDHLELSAAIDTYINHGLKRTN